MRHLVPSIALLVFLATAASADEFERVRPVADPLTAKECGECHMAYQPGLLPAASWNRVIDTLADHFGDNATLPPASAEAIRAYLTANAGGGDGGLTRITRQRWFTREHREDGRRHDASGQAKPIRNSDCRACHHGAERGRYE